MCIIGNSEKIAKNAPKEAFLAATAKVDESQYGIDWLELL